MEKISIDFEGLENQPAEIHLLPCKIIHDGKCDVHSYFTSSISKVTHIEKETKYEVLENGLRGRPLNGVVVKLGDEKLGLVIDEKSNNGTKSHLGVKKFTEIYSWQLDEPKLNEKNEPFNKALKDWYATTEIVNE